MENSLLFLFFLTIKLMYPHVEYILQVAKNRMKSLDDETLGSFKKAMQQKHCLSRLSKKVCISVYAKTPGSPYTCNTF